MLSGREEDALAKERLAQLIKQLRGNKTQREFAKQLGTSYTAIQDWEKAIRLPGEKNLKRIAELLGWSQGKLVRYLFRTSNQAEISLNETLDDILAQSQDLSYAEIEILISHLRERLNALQKVNGETMQTTLDNKQKHNLHLLLRASLKNRSLTEIMDTSGIAPELFTDVVLRNDQNWQIEYSDLEKFSRFCCRVIQWLPEQLPRVDCNETYLGKTDVLLKVLSGTDQVVMGDIM